MPSNTAAYLVAEKVTPLEVKPAPYTKPAQGQLVVKVHAVAINPLDKKLQLLAMVPLQYPKILGADVSGEVVEIGEGVRRFKVGDRACGVPVGIFFDNEEAAFQEYVVLRDALAAPIPDSMSYETATVIPLCASTAACGLFQRDFLGLQHPSVDAKPTGETLLVYGGSSATGLNGIQLAVAAGYDVISTASPRNFDLIKRVGAKQVFDYKSPTIVDDLIGALKGKKVVGALDCIGKGGAAEITSQALAASEGRKFVAGTQSPDTAYATGVEGKRIFGYSLQHNEVGKALWVDFLPQALASGRYLALPEPVVAGRGLDKIQEALEMQASVSAKKVVVTL